MKEKTIQYREESRQALPGELIKSLVDMDTRGVTFQEADDSVQLLLRKGETYRVAETYWISGVVRLENPSVNLRNQNYVVLVPDCPELTDEQLEAIASRAETARKKDWDPRHTMISVGIDIPALLAEIKRLKRELAEKEAAHHAQDVA